MIWFQYKALNLPRTRNIRWFIKKSFHTKKIKAINIAIIMDSVTFLIVPFVFIYLPNYCLHVFRITPNTSRKLTNPATSFLRRCSPNFTPFFKFPQSFFNITRPPAPILRCPEGMPYGTTEGKQGLGLYRQRCGKGWSNPLACTPRETWGYIHHWQSQWFWGKIPGSKINIKRKNSCSSDNNNRSGENREFPACVWWELGG